METQEKNTSIKFNILAIVCIILFSFALAPVTLQNDTFYTIKIGEHILENGIDMQDPFSWHEDLNYTYPHWAYDTVIYLIYNLGEISGLPDGGMLFIYISTAILACILGVLIYITATKVSKNKLISFFVTIFVMYFMKDFIAARKHNTEKKIFNRNSNYLYNDSKCSCCSMAILLCTIYAICSRIYNSKYIRC